MSRFEGTTAIITGAGRGLGAALAFSLAQEGCDVVLCGRSLTSLEDTARGIIEHTGRRAETVQVDLSDMASVTAAIATIEENHPVIDILINNGAMWLEDRQEDFSIAEVAGVINAAVTGTFLFTQGLLPLLNNSSRPDIVTIGSVSGLSNAPLQTVSVPFYAAKRAQAALADGLRQKLAGTPVRSLIVHPPYLEDATPLEDNWQASSRRKKGDAATSRDIVESVIFALTRPRHVSLSIMVDADEGGVFG